MSLRVLAIDDSPEIHALLAVHLKPEGLELTSSIDWERGLELATTIAPDLILLDVEMPGTTGLDLCRRLKESPRTHSIPVIFLTASNDIQMKVHGFDLGAVDYVTKPFHPAELRARVRAALRMKRAQDMLTERAQVDALTGLRNRAFFDERLAREIAEADATGQPLSLVLIDLDHFKRVNDVHGHPFGDLVLQRVADVVQRGVRPCDAACRYGGEELAVIIPGVNRDTAAGIAERIRESIRGLAFVPGGSRLVVTGSFGVAELGDLRDRTIMAVHREAFELVSAADQALYRAKDEGRDRVCVFDGDEVDVPILSTRKAS